MIGAEKVMTMTSTYDHRIIQGAESGQFLKVVDEYLQGDHEFYEQVFADLGAQIGAAPQPPAPAAAAAAQRDAAVEQPTAAGGIPVAPDEALLQAVQAATSLLKAHRMHGHLAARLDPLASEPEGDPALDPETVGLTPELMARIPAKILRTYVPGATLADALPHLRETYCGTIAYEIEHIASHRQRTWLREKIESGAYRTPLTHEEQRTLLRRLTQVDSLERFMHKAYLGQKQFSIEGLDMTVPMLDEMIQLSSSQGAREVVIGMSHRGRLNVLAHCLGRAYETIFREFEGASSIEAVTTIPQGGTGDVKYHHGAQGTYQLPDDSSIIVRLESNPSHLEYVGPVVEGATRAIQTTRQGPHAHLDNNAAIPVILHGDAAFPGQGVVAETFNLQGLDGYTVGGTLHLIQNNQVGFTTDPDDSRSTRWASDLAKGFDVPIIHVNADDVAACIAAVRLAFAFRQEFGHDVLIDLIGYRRFGHNEADEPAYTQPEMAAKIKDKTAVRDLYAARLVEQGVVTQEESEAIAKEIWENLAQRHRELKSELSASDEEQPTGGYELDRSPSPEVKTAVSRDRLLGLNEDLLRIPDGFTVHPKLVKQLERRRETVGEDGGIDWAQAESLAYASLLSEGTPIRLTGQDTERGTFSQRHLVLHDPKTGQRISPIQSLPGALAPMELHNSPLSEVACLGFEYGYSMEAPETLVLWEAQFGDFVNSAQVIIDQFIVSALSKWGQSTRLTLLLPHGYEGSGPEHSSGRMERFLQLAAEGNIRVANLTTPAQYFHLLRRQARVAKQRPLVILTPKSLLRLPQATSRIEHLSESRFYPVLPEPRIDEEKVTRLVLCSGKIYYDLKGHATRENNESVAITRVELLYPFPQQQILDEVARYPNLREVAWVQEEPRNMGPRTHMSPRLLQILPSSLEFGYVGRPERASPGEGYPAAHTMEQNRIIRTALDLGTPGQREPDEAAGRALARELSAHRLGGRRELGREALEQREPAGVDLGGAADGVGAGGDVALLRDREAGPEQQLVGLRARARTRARTAPPPRRRGPRPSARRPRRPARRRAGACAAARARRPGRGGPRRAGRSAAATAPPRRARRSAPPTGGRARRRRRPRRPRARSAAGRRGRPRRSRTPPTSRRAPWRGPSCSPGRPSARRSRRRPPGCSRRRCGPRRGPARRRRRPGARRRARRSAARPRVRSPRRRRPRAGRARAVRARARRRTASRPRRSRAAPTCRASRRRTSATAPPRRARRSPGRARRSSTCRAAAASARHDTPVSDRAARVLARVRNTPPGFVRTYGDVSPGAPRFAGTVLFSCDDPTVPWHRIVRADGSLAKGERQRRLLEAEGDPVPRRPRRHARRAAAGLGSCGVQDAATREVPYPGLAFPQTHPTGSRCWRSCTGSSRRRPTARACWRSAAPTGSTSSRWPATRRG